jgi:hypothetical protein
MGGGEFPRSNYFYLPSLCVEEGGGRSAPCGPNSLLSGLPHRDLKYTSHPAICTRTVFLQILDRGDVGVCGLLLIASTEYIIKAVTV